MSKLENLLPQTALLAFLGALLISLGAASSEPVHEVTLRARGMAFYLDGETAPNPVLVLPGDHPIRLTFVNEDRGVDHNLILADLGVQTEVLAGNGSRQVLKFQSPARGTSSSYSCSLHPTMMMSRLEIR